MPQMTPFKYGGFWDVPRYLVLQYRRRLLLLKSEFDEELDDYASEYTVYALPDSAAVSIREGSWGHYIVTPLPELGQIPVTSVLFDETKRKELDASCLDDILDKNESVQ